MFRDNLTLAWRNLWRRPVRTVLTVLAVGMGAGTVTFFFGIQLSSYGTMIDAATGLYQGHLQIQRTDYLNKPRVESTFSTNSILQQTLAANPLIQGVAPRAFGFALVSSEERTYGVQVVGVEPSNEDVVSRLPKLIREGRYLAEGDENGVVIGRKLASNLRVGIGSELSFLGQAVDGSLAAFVAPVVGIFDTGAAELDRNVVQVGLGYFQENFALGEQVHTVVIRISDTDDTEVVQEAISQRLAQDAAGSDVVALRWDEVTPGLREAIVLDQIAGWMFFFALIVIGTFILVNTLMLSVLERRHEFSVMLAIGMEWKRLFLMVLLESMQICILGVFLGLTVSSLFIIHYGSAGFTVAGAEELMKVWNVPAVLYPKLTVVGMTLVPSIVLVLGFLGSLFPAFRASQISILDGLRSR